ncbi:NADH--cytochrome b5 reductase 1-like isoform X2 [Alnus glutinosa]|uniref:NADH--cytochrome b5 reductase 1-like isoform X2 n=1 Tax=Alnus glutinosa TaxID=3517 RepID=UPI002D78EDED|nr:NADH--cytochrome b5 reductase 1-like isoform X2 [Alnus glutinosa]
MFKLPFESMQIPDAELRGLAVALALVGVSAGFLYYANINRGCLNPKKFIEFKLVKKTQLSHNTAKFRFALPTASSVLGLPVGQHVLCRGKDSEGEQVVRPYTPITLDSDVGYFELVVKMYPKGKMSHHFREMQEGDCLPVKGPQGRFKYKPGQARAFGMLAGGSGITPMFQEELDAFASKFPSRFKVYYVLNQPPVPWNGGTGFVSKEMIQTHCPAPAKDIQILRCGPPAMNKAMAAHLNELGYTLRMQFQF